MSRDGAPQNFKDLLERKVAELGIEMIPVPGKFREAKPVWSLGGGKAQIYIDRNVIFIREQENQWVPIGMEQLLKRVK